MNTFADVIDAFGPGEMATILGVKPQRVYTMRFRNSIPVDHWSVLVKAAPDAGVDGLTLELLAKIRAAHFSRSKAS